MQHIDTLNRIAALAYEGRASRKPKVFLRQICELADDTVDTAHIAMLAGGSASVNAIDGTLVRSLP